jgi:UDP-2,4-diacetamido-2,4,6-trideoxy-beta-L-altropyranose hydrolase
MRCAALVGALLKTPSPLVERGQRAELTADLLQPHPEKEADPELQLQDAEWCRQEIGDQCDLLILDHYGLGAIWEYAMRDSARVLVAIDDLGRPHVADLCVDQNLPLREYWSVSNPLLGPRYAMLDASYAEHAGKFEVRPEIERVMVSFGGNPPVGLVPLVVNELCKFWEGASRRQAASPGACEAQARQAEGVATGAGTRKEITVLLPETHPDANLVNCAVRWLPAGELAEEMLRHDLVIGAGGSSSWERCALGIPSIVLTTADNQVPLSRALHESGASLYLGSHESAFNLIVALETLELIAARLKMSEQAKQVTDGRGASRVARRILEVLETK